MIDLTRGATKEASGDATKEACGDVTGGATKEETGDAIEEASGDVTRDDVIGEANDVEVDDSCSEEDSDYIVDDGSGSEDCGSGFEDSENSGSDHEGRMSYFRVNDDDVNEREELHSASESDSDYQKKKVKFPEFNTEVDMVNPQFQKGMVFSDANDSIYPIAYVVVEAESQSSWDWFMSLLTVDLEIESDELHVLEDINTKCLLDPLINMSFIWNIIHVLAGSEISQRLESYVDHCYHITTQQEIYNHFITPMKDPNQWVEDTTCETVIEPKFRRPPGRPKKKRVNEADAPLNSISRFTKKGVTIYCSKFGKAGHNQRACKGEVDANMLVNAPKRKENQQSGASVRLPKFQTENTMGSSIPLMRVVVLRRSPSIFVENDTKHLLEKEIELG
ncbi:hypothetical protein V6N13_142143 [Hibiscus sabdariffa]